MRKVKIIITVVAFLLLMQGCAGRIVGTVTDIAIEVAKIPFKVGGAIIDVMTDDDSERDKQQ